MPAVFAYPHRFVAPPKGDYYTLDEEFGSGWNNVYVVSPTQHPAVFYEDFVKQNIPGDFVVPMTEEAILASAYINEQLDFPGLSLTSAMNCVCRERQRATIDLVDPELNPKWMRADSLQTMDWSPCIVKAGSSTLSYGVKKACPDTLVLAIQEVRQSAYYELARTARVLGVKPITIIEEYIEGEQYEISGIVGANGEILHWFNALHQSWDSGRILKYQPALWPDTIKLRKLVEPVVRAFDFVNCCFNIEVRGNKIIEIQPRLGEEGGEYESLISSKSSTQVVYDVLTTHRCTSP